MKAVMLNLAHQAQPLPLILIDSEAQKLLQAFIDNDMDPIVHGETSDGVPFAVRSDSILAIHLIDTAKLQQQGVMGQTRPNPNALGGGFGGRNLSGI